MGVPAFFPFVFLFLPTVLSPFQDVSLRTSFLGRRMETDNIKKRYTVVKKFILPSNLPSNIQVLWVYLEKHNFLFYFSLPFYCFKANPLNTARVSGDCSKLPIGVKTKTWPKTQVMVHFKLNKCLHWSICAENVTKCKKGYKVDPMIWLQNCILSTVQYDSAVQQFWWFIYADCIIYAEKSRCYFSPIHRKMRDTVTPAVKSEG